jgi:hypothetical protein
MKSERLKALDSRRATLQAKSPDMWPTFGCTRMEFQAA